MDGHHRMYSFGEMYFINLSALKNMNQIAYNLTEAKLHIQRISSLLWKWSLTYELIKISIK